MTWQLTAFALLLVALAGGFAWYERSQPSSRVVALVAALAALAVAGRIVLAPVPNVVATTDIALITGYAMGGAPGFAVGALAAPVSNLWLGQGPWTPWQMAGWGLCGLGGAALAAATGRRLGRVGLATACALAGFAYGALLDLSVMVTYGGEQSLDRYLALSARGLPFNIAHAAGNFALALAAGPALVRMISRFRERLEFTWSPAPGIAARAGPVLLVVGCVLAVAGRPGDPRIASAATDSERAPAGARVWLERAQNADGGFGFEPGARSSVGMTSWAILGLEAAGRNPLDLQSRGHSPVDWLRSRASGLNEVNELELAILSLAGAGVSPYGFGGENLVAKLRAKEAPDGSFANENLTAFAVFALRAASVSQAQLGESAGWLARAQNRDGGWGATRTSRSDSDTTGAVLQALAAAGRRGPVTDKGLRFLRGVQLRDGGFPNLPGGPSNSQSTAWAVQGILAAGGDPGAFVEGGRTPFDYLAARQAANGHYRFSESSDQTPVWVTAQALPAVARRTFPLGRVPRATEPGGIPLPGERGRDAKRGPAGPEDRGGARGPSDERDKAGGRSRDRADKEAVASQRGGSDRLATATLAAREGAEDTEAGDRELTRYLLGALGLVAAGLGGGFVWYRRHLP